MKTHRTINVRTLFIAIFITTLVTTFVAAKRLPPKEVTPVVSDGIQYSVAGDGRNQYVVATDVKSGDALWKVRVFNNRIKSGLEGDVQWVFITDLQLVGSSLFAKDEKERCYAVSLKTQKVTKQSCGEFKDVQHADSQK
jgi:hypothetical protein